MGCDIHMRAEVKISTPNNPKPTWKAVGRVFRSQYYRPKEVTVEGGYNEILTNEPYDGRNYDLFAILADVRNGRGFAGCDTGDGFKPIVDPRGVPEDASEVYKKMVEEWGIDGHSHSWVTLDEIKAYNWSQVTKSRGYVDVVGYKKFKKTGNPYPCSGDICGHSIIKLTNKQMDMLIKGAIPPHGLIEKPEYITQIEWEETYAKCAGSFLTKTVPTLEKLLTKEYVQEVRLVFFFDN